MVHYSLWSKSRKLHQIMCLAFCLSVVCFALTSSAWAAGTTNNVGVPSTYASETTMYTWTQAHQYVDYTLVSNTAFGYNSDISRVMGVARSLNQNFFVVVTLSGGAGFAGTLPTADDLEVLLPPGYGAWGVTLAAPVSLGDQSVTFLVNVTSDFLGFPTLYLHAGSVGGGTTGWTIRDYSNALKTGPIMLTVKTFDANTYDPVDDFGGTDTRDIARTAPGLTISQALDPTTAVIDVSTIRTLFVDDYPDSHHTDRGASLGLGYASPRVLSYDGGQFELSGGDIAKLTFTSTNSFNGVEYIEWDGLTGSYNVPKTTYTINVSAANFNNYANNAQDIEIRIDGDTDMALRSINVMAQAVLADNQSVKWGNTETLLATSTVTTWSYNGSVLLANWLNGNSDQYFSRIYLWNPSSIEAKVYVRVFALPVVTGGVITSTELTTPGMPLVIGTLGASSGVNIRLAEDILAPLSKAPYTENGGNVAVEITVETIGANGTCQVFYKNGGTAFGQAPLVDLSQAGDSRWWWRR